MADNKGRVGVAISTTGSVGRLGFLETCVAHWDKMLPEDSSLFVTVDGDEHDLLRVQEVVKDVTLSVFRVGQGPQVRDGRMGVAVNKNTGLELLMQSAYRPVEHLFLSDDDTWPLLPQALDKHINLSVPHSMVCWGLGRLAKGAHEDYTPWKWPRGVMIYTRRYVVEQVGGMDERFGPGGHEHAEWSRRIHQHGFTPYPFISPASYAETGPSGKAMRAGILWNCEDMPRPGEDDGTHRSRKRRQGTVRRQPGDWTRIEKIMEERDGDTSYVPYRAGTNGRLSATLSTDLMRQGD